MNIVRIIFLRISTGKAGSRIVSDCVTKRKISFLYRYEGYRE